MVSNQIQYPIKVFIYGLTGRMGQEISALVSQMPEFELVGGSSLSKPCPLAPCDVVLDFSHPGTLKKNLEEVVTSGTAILVGTTGFTEEEVDLCKDASKKIQVLYAPNTSLGITVLKNLVMKAAAQLDQSYDIEIFETHHREKIDAPSGTALKLGEAAKEGRVSWGATGISVNLPLDRQGKRPVASIGYAVHRGGGISGDHAVRFIGDEEVIELSHRSLSRKLFARGALTAAKWLAEQAKDKPGFYGMDDILRPEDK